MITSKCRLINIEDKPDSLVTPRTESKYMHRSSHQL